MKILNKILPLFVIILLNFFQSNSQVLQPVKWKFSSKRVSANEAELIFTAKIDKTWHLYSQFMDEGGPVPTKFDITKSKDFETIGLATEFPKPTEEFDKSFNMKVKFFSIKATFKQKIKILNQSSFIIKGTVSFMCCDDQRCLPPEDVEFEFKIDKFETTNKTDSFVTEKKNLSENIDTNLAKDTDKKIKLEKIIPKNITTANNAESDNSLWFLFVFSFLAGLAAILTPCVFPMIPMTVSFFMHNNDNKNKARFQALVYGSSIILIYTVIGTIVAVTLGANFANWLSTHWIPNVFFFLIFVIFAFSFFGLFEITLPSWLINKSDKQADKGGFSGAFFMAFTLVLVSFSCTGPIVGAILVKSAGGQVLEPIIGMLGFSLAFALPFTFFAFFPSLLSSLPKSGGWLNSVKVVLGFLELALGLKFLSIADQVYIWRILDREVYLAIWIVIFTLLGFYLLGKLKFSHDSDVKHISVPRLMLSIITFSFVVYMIPGMFGAPLKALSGYLPPQTSLDFDINSIVRDNAVINSSNVNSTECEKPKYSDFLHLPHGLNGFFDYEQGMACAKKLNKPVFIDFTGHGCVNCREMEANVWSDPKVLQKLRNDFVVIALYVDDKTELPKSEWIVSKYDGKIKKTLGKKYADLQISKYNVNAQPYYVLLDNEGNLLTQPRAYNLDVDEFIKFLDKGIEEYKKIN